MAHPYAKHKGKHHSKERVAKVFGHAHAKPAHLDAAEDESMIRKMVKKESLKTHGSRSADRMDKYARGGKVKGGKGHHTKINIVVAPKAGGADVPPPPMGAPAGGPPPMPPKAPMGPPPGGPMGGGMPGIGMKRGGGAMPQSGIASSDNLKKWADYASKNTRYARGGKVPMKAGAISGEGRLEKIKAYGKNARRGS